MTTDGPDNDLPTVAAIAVIAMCLVTFNHEALGHGGACLALGGHIRVLTSSIFRCDMRSVWIAPAGPFGNLLGGVLALLFVRVVPRRRTNGRLFLVLVAGFAFFWEAGYLVTAMCGRDGDLYFAAQDLFGEPALWWRLAGAAAGIALYLVSIRWASRVLTDLWPDAVIARHVARIAWVAASLGAVLAATADSGAGWTGLRDAALEIGAGAFPWLLIPRQGRAHLAPAAPLRIERNYAIMATSLIMFAVFVATLGRGLRF